MAETGRRLEIVAFRGADSEEVVMDDDRGVFFSTDESYASQYGVVRSYLVVIGNPLVVTEEQAQGMIEIDRNVLLAQGYDGRVVAYEDGSLDVVAFHLDQFTALPGAAPSAF